MKPQALFVTLVVVAVLVALPLAECQVAGHPKPAPWPCCDNCAICNFRFPPSCFCKDESPRGCHPACKNCVKSTGNDGKPVFQCEDLITNFCKHRCMPAA